MARTGKHRAQAGGGSRELVYPPLNTPKAVAEGVWVVDSGPIHAAGLPLPIRMTVLRQADGGLLLYSPTPWSPELAAKIEALGPIRNLVAPNIGHWMFLKEWQDRHPNALTWAAPGLRTRKAVQEAGVRIDHELGATAPAAWGPGLELVATPGAGFVEIALFHRPSGTLVLSDLLQSVRSKGLPPIRRCVADTLRITSQKGSPPIYLRLALMLNAQGASDAVARLIALNPERVVFAHGDWFETDGADRLRQAFGWLLSGREPMTLQGKSVVITGASSGIGRAAARAFASQGCAVTLAARRREVLEEVAKECEALGGKALVAPTDVTDPAAVNALAAQAEAAFGGIDVWINNAGVGVFGPYQDADIALHRRTVEVNLLGAMHGAWAALPVFLRQGHGVLINNISLGGWAPTPFASAYTASKFGLRGFTASLREELAEHPAIKVCAVFPSIVDTPGFTHGANVSGRKLDPGPLLYRSEDVAETFVRLVHRPQDEIAVGWPARLGQAAYAIAPSLTERIVGTTFRRLLARARPAPHSHGALLSPLSEGVDTSGHWLATKKLPSAHTISVGLAAVLVAGAAGLLVRGASRRYRSRAA